VQRPGSRPSSVSSPSGDEAHESRRATSSPMSPPSYRADAAQLRSHARLRHLVLARSPLYLACSCSPARPRPPLPPLPCFHFELWPPQWTTARGPPSIAVLARLSRLSTSALAPICRAELVPIERRSSSGSCPERSGCREAPQAQRCTGERGRGTGHRLADLAQLGASVRHHAVVAPARKKTRRRFSSLTD
jgi:hypothetical protein